MLQLEFTEEDRKALLHERFHHPHPRVQQRMEAVWLKSHGLPHHQIADMLQIADSTLHDYLHAYQEGGIERLKSENWKGRRSALESYVDGLKNFLCSIPRRMRPKRENTSSG